VSANRVAAALAIVTLASAATPAYLKFGAEVASGTVPLKWTRLPVRYFVTDRGVPGASATDLDAVLTRAFRSWEDVGRATITFERGGFTGSTPFEPDGVTVVGFLSRPDLERTLGATAYSYDTRTGAIIEADIFLNSEFPWSVAAAGETGRFDLESVALHEIGHLTGLGHSALGETELRPGGGRRVIGAEAVMFPIAFLPGSTAGRILRPDDVAGVSDIYPDPRFRAETGSITGRVLKDGRGVFGAHLVAFNLRTGDLVGGYTLSDDGRFTLAGLGEGPHVVRVEPLDDGDVESFFEDVDRVDLDFSAAFADRTVVVTAGHNAGDLTIRVSPR
jgi:hypothetical protein